MIKEGYYKLKGGEYPLCLSGFWGGSEYRGRKRLNKLLPVSEQTILVKPRSTQTIYKGEDVNSEEIFSTKELDELNKNHKGTSIFCILVPTTSLIPSEQTKLKEEKMANNTFVQLLVEKLQRISGKKVVLTEDATDEQRIREIMDKANGDDTKAVALAQTMANRITDPIKAYNRGKAAEMENYHAVAEVFYNRADVLGHPEREIQRQNDIRKAQKTQQADITNTNLQQALAKANPRDIERVNEIKAKAAGNHGKEVTLAETMAKLLGTPEKAWNRFLAAREVFGDGSSVARAFLNRAVELQHPEALKLDAEKSAQWKLDSEINSKQALARATLKAERFLKEFKSRYPQFQTSISTSNPASPLLNFSPP